MAVQKRISVSNKGENQSLLLQLLHLSNTWKNIIKSLLQTLRMKQNVQGVALKA